MEKLATKSLLFLLPIVLYYAFPFFVMFESGEFTSIDTVIKAQAGDYEVQFGPAYEDFESAHKQALIAELNPQVVIIGSSLVNQFRSSLFRSNVSFVNGWWAVPSGTFGDIQELINANASSSRLSVLILGIDPKQLDAERASNRPDFAPTVTQQISDFFTINSRRVYQDFFAGKIVPSTLASRAHGRNAIGLDALVYHDGTLDDGSYFFGHRINEPDHVAKVQQEIHAASVLHLDLGSTVLEKNTIALKSLLEYCKERGIHVIGFTPPHPREVFAQSERGLHSPQFSSYQASVLASIFSSSGFPFFDYTDASSVQIDDSEFIDDAHTTDKAAAKMILDMALHDTELQKYVSVQDVRAILSHASSSVILQQPPTTPLRH